VPVWIFVGLVATASLAVTILITLTVITRHGKDARTGVGADAALRDRGLRGGALHEPAPGDPPVLSTLPEFRLVERAGGVFSSDDLAGKVWVADFIFTRCGGTCPLMSQEMSNLQGRLRSSPRWDDIRLVSFSVDPVNDTPEVLRAYAESYKADPRHWLFLTGSRPDVWKLCKEGFKLAVGEDNENLQMPITHSSRFALVDQRGRIRGYYDPQEEDGRARLAADIDKVLAESPAVSTSQPATKPASRPAAQATTQPPL
jgi:cytochrome oxidase Cu insertion factor (SCO1/SenC/PrrC family)